MCKIKICGITDTAAIPAINRLTPDYVGFIMTRGFKRSVSDDFVKKCGALLNSRIKKVGVFVNDDVHRIAWLVQDGTIDVVQLHGDEDGEYIRALKALTPVAVIKAVGVQGDRVDPWPVECDFVLLDSCSKEARGGTGKRVAWRRYDEIDKPFFLAGGITPSNVAQAIAAVHPFGVDSSGGLETDGRKDEQKICQYIANIREAEI